MGILDDHKRDYENDPEYRKFYDRMTGKPDWKIGLLFLVGTVLAIG